MTILHIDSSIQGSDSVSRRLTAKLVDTLRQGSPGVDVAYRDLVANPIPTFSGTLFSARSVSPDDRTPEQQRTVDAADAVLNEFLAADVVVVGAPMYNFAIASQLKNWIDHLAVRGKTFAYSANGPVGLVSNKRIIVVASSGGFYGPQSAMAAMDFEVPYLRTIFSFFGITDLEVIRAEGLGHPDKRLQSLAAAETAIETLSHGVTAFRSQVAA